MRWWLDGGEVTPNLIPLWSALTGVMLWPARGAGDSASAVAVRGWRRTIAHMALSRARDVRRGVVGVHAFGSVFFLAVPKH